jgi:aryl-alcohol dehydrogenase-like predicted oxidoreductase
MQYRKFGKTSLTVSEIGFGAWAIGGDATIGNTAIGWGPSDDAVSAKALHAALDAGINFFDTADIYGLGHSEDLIGKHLASQKDLVIATKAGNVARNEEFTIDYTKNHILNACEASLKRLKRDVIDFYQLHTARLNHLQNGECIEAMQQLQKEGKIRYWGLSLNTFEPFAEAEFLLENQLGQGFQLVLNLINQKALPLLAKASAQGYGIIARMPLQFGLLTGKFDQQASFAEKDHRKNRLTANVIEQTQKALEPVWALCAKYQCSKTQLALSYILSYPETSVVIPGIRTPQQVSANTEGLFQLDPEDRVLIESLGTGEFIQLMALIRQQG